MNKVKRKWPWIAEQQWENLLFIHWPVPYEILRPFVPNVLELDTYNGQAWISVIPFYTSKTRLRGVPYITPFRGYLELNIRTYVRFDDEPGVYFFALDANNKWVVAGARGLFSLPYTNAKMHLSRNNETISFESQRQIRDDLRNFSISYQPSAHTYYAKENTLIHWLTERYCLYTFRGHHILKGPMTHEQWLLQDAELRITKNEVVNFLPHTYLQQTPRVQFSKMKKAYFHPFELIGKFS